MIARKIKKLPLVDRDGTLLGLMTAKDLLKQKHQPFATRDAQGRLRVGAAIGATGDYLERAVEVLRAGADVLVDRHRARALAGDGTGARRRFASGSTTSTSSPATWRRPRARGFCSIAASTPSRSASVRAAAARRG